MNIREYGNTWGEYVTKYQRIILRLLIQCTGMLIAMRWEKGRETIVADGVLAEAKRFMDNDVVTVNDNPFKSKGTTLK